MIKNRRQKKVPADQLNIKLTTMQKAPYFFLLILSFISSSCLSQKKDYSDYEKNCIRVFNDFTNYMHACIKEKEGPTDSARLNYILSHFLFTNSKIDTSHQIANDLNALSNDKMNNLKTELNSFYRYLQEREHEDLADNLTIIPIRLGDDKYIYNNLKSFQKENTFIFYDKRSADKILGYILFMPPMKNLITSAKIWSWTLEFKFGKFVFKSVTGEEGKEYMYSPEGFKSEPKEP